MHGSGLLRLDRALGGGVGVPLPLRGGRASTARRVSVAKVALATNVCLYRSWFTCRIEALVPVPVGGSGTVAAQQSAY